MKLTCNTCVDQGLMTNDRMWSMVHTDGRGYGDPANVSVYWDEHGTYHFHDRVLVIDYFKCSYGHRFAMNTGAPCSAEGCKFGVPTWEDLVSPRYYWHRLLKQHTWRVDTLEAGSRCTKCGDPHPV